MKHIDLVYTHWKFSVNCVWSDWANSWSGCSKSCGGGIRTTSRKKLTEAYNGGENCTGSEIKEEECNPNKCPGTCNVLQISQFQVASDKIKNLNKISNFDAIYQCYFT